MPVQVTSTIQIPEQELIFVFSRSGGPGGQNVNKVSTRVELLFDLNASRSLSDEEKERLRARLGSRIDAGGTLHVASQESRSQWRNRELAVEKFSSLIQLALARKKARVASKPTKASKRRRVDRKKTHSAKKAMRGRVHLSNE